MSRLSLVASLAALALLGGGAGGFALSREAWRTEGSEEAVEAPSVPPTAPPASLASSDGGQLLRVGNGESLAAALLRKGVGGLDSALADKAAAELAVRWDRPARIWLGRSLAGGARELDRVELRGAGSQAFALERFGGYFNVRRITVTVDNTPVRLRLTAGSDLGANLRAAALPEPLRRQLLDLARPFPGARLDAIIAHEEASGQSLYGPVLYVALSRSSGEVRRWLGKEDGALRPLGLAVGETGGLERPVSGRVTSAIGLRLHPVLRFLRWHRGTDFAAPYGTPVRAAATGRVVEAGWRGGYGRVVRLAHADGSVTAYAHLSRVDTRVGEEVQSGALIGLVGDSGLATGPHLHFEWLKDGRALQPVFAGSINYSPQPLDAATLASLRALLAAPYREPPSPPRLARAEGSQAKPLKGPA